MSSDNGGPTWDGGILRRTDGAVLLLREDGKTLIAIPAEDVAELRGYLASPEDLTTVESE